MRILFLSNYYPPYHRGGYEELCQEVAIELNKRGHSISVLTTHTDRNRTEQNGLYIYRLLHPEVYPGSIVSELGFFFGRQSRLNENLCIFQETIKNYSPDIVLVWGMWNLSRQLLIYAESITTTKTAYYIADYWPCLPDAYTLHWQSPSRIRQFNLIKKVIARMVLGEGNRQFNRQNLLFNNVICVSKYVRENLIRDVCLPDTAAVINNGIDINKFLYNKTTLFVDEHNKHLRMLYAGRINIEKGVDLGIHALSELNRIGINTSLDIIGNGSKEYIEELHALCIKERITDKVKFLGSVTRDMMPSVLSTFDILLVPSRWADPLPRIIQEGMAVGCVVVASDIGGIPEIIEDGVNGLLFSPGDHYDLESKILHMYKNPTLFEQYSSEGRKTVEERFTIKKMVDKIETYLHQIV